MPINDKSNSRQQSHAAAYFQELGQLFGETPEIHPIMFMEPYRHLYVVNNQTKASVATIVTIPIQVTVTLMDELRAYTFLTDQHEDPFDFARQMEGDASTLELWAAALLSARGIGEMEECMLWNGEAYRSALQKERANWAGRTLSCTEEEGKVRMKENYVTRLLIESDPDMREVIRLNQSLTNVGSDLPERISPQDFVEWDPAFMRAVYLLNRAANMQPSRMF